MGTSHSKSSSSCRENILDFVKMKMFFIGLLLAGVSAELGCIREHNTNYGGDMIEQVPSENAQDCAEHCAKNEEGLYWTFHNRTCTVRKSIPSRGGAWNTISGNRQCGLFTMRGWPFGETVGKLTPKAVTIGSQATENSSPDGCADKNHETKCTVPASPAPWLALDFGSRTQVNRVDIRFSKGARLWDFEVRVTDSLPTSVETMSKNGTLLASYLGASPHWQAITIEFPPSGPQPEGRYVLLQQNRTQVLEVVEFSASFEGLVESTTNATTSATTSGTSSATSTTSLLALLTCLVLVSCRGCVKPVSACPKTRY